MKKILFMLALFTIIFPTITSAHTGLESSNPAEGAVVKEERKELTLQFKTKIESLSSMQIVRDDGQEIELDSLIVEEKKMSGKLTSALDNGSYIIQWRIIGTDGHPIEGQIPFKVQIEKKEDVNPSAGEETEKGSQEQKKEENVSDKKEEMSPVFFITLGFLLAAIVFFLKIAKRKI
ncbi:copper resistance protein CopC [Fictibacillus aquaticus]|uniref:CopC domain-containing protein n=1 Tax=Fictibacillus aquaticus TaxID=2021314 RepID=A0A235F5L4_9BACL|nr:copper resistance protein CopC [Fictibacillus aquaticus]OYD55995.1 hypothetical protein CGZ90_19930 [Fictibacillus aquaticus]